MAETEGYLDTREGRINAIIRAVRDYPQPEIDQSTFEHIARECGIDPTTLTQKELNKIQTKISR